MEMPARMGKYRDKKNSKDQNQNIRRNFFKKDVNSNKSEGSFTDCDIRETMKQSQKPNTSFAKSNKTPTSSSVLSTMAQVAKSTKTPTPSSVLATMAQAARQDKWIEYNVAVEEELNNTKEDKLANWLENNKPSKILRSSGVGWICLTVSTPPPDPHSKTSELEQAWDSLTFQKNEVTISDVRELATKFAVTGGKWLLHVNSSEVDEVWRVVATAVHAGHLGPNVYRAKVSPVSDVDDVNNEHVIQVYNEDFTDEEEVLEVEASLRQANLRYVLQYKPQIFSVLGIYRNNRLGLRPSIYQSQYEMNEERPVIESILEKSWFWNNAQGCGSDEGIGKADERGDKNKDGRIIQRPCNYYNDVGLCEFSSGHLSKSGFTERMHLCRYCFNVKGREEFHSELRCQEKSRTEQNASNCQNEISQPQIVENSARDARSKGNVVARPCDHFNDVGSCKFISGHLSQSGFTRRLHICRLCFSMDGNEENHSESNCDRRRRNVNAENLLNVINSLNQLKVAELINEGSGEGRSYDSRGGFPAIQNGRENENHPKGGLAISGGVYGGASKNCGKENARPHASKEKRNPDFQRDKGKTKNELKGRYDNRELNERRDTETRDIDERRSEKLRGKLDQSTPRSRLYQNVSYGKEREPQKELQNLGKEQEKDKSSKDASNVQDEDKKERKFEKNELQESKRQRKKITKNEDSLEDKKRIDGEINSDLNKCKSKKNGKQDKSETIGKKESLSKGKKDKKNNGKVKPTVNAIAESKHTSTADAKCREILDANMSTKECSNKVESNSTEKKGSANNQSKEDSNIGTIEEKRPMPNVEITDKTKENEKPSEEKKAMDDTSSQTKDKKLKDIKLQEINPGKLSPGGQNNAKSTASKYGGPRSTSEKGFQTPPRFEKFRSGFVENKFSEKFPNPPTLVENKLTKPPTFVENKFSNPPPFVEKKFPKPPTSPEKKFSNPPPFVEKKFPNAPRFFERKYPVAPRFAEKFPSGPKFEKGFRNPMDYTKKTPNFGKNQGKERKGTHCPCPPYCTDCLAAIKNRN